MSRIEYKITSGFEAVRPLVEAVARDGVPGDAEIIYNGRRNKVYTLPSPGDIPYKQLNIKAYRVPPWINRVAYRWFRPGKARRAFDNANELLARGFMTARPVAFVEEKGALLYGRSYFFSEQLGPEWENLRGAHEWPDFDFVACQVARYMAELHRKEVWMKDFSPGNVLMKRHGDGTVEFALIDINRMEFGVTDRDKLVTNFQAIFDTVEAVGVLARHYADATGLAEGSDARDRLMADARNAFVAKHLQIARKRRLKKIFLGRK
ncbi:MAG: lipopolysaccharide kinase InaA family protein [Duncaniella sp.]|nr:lipopolysaccharide kinase InaA family protein [Duncaniella sp.]